MKNRYDQNSVSRTFKPGDTVPALLPVPGRHCKLDILVLTLSIRKCYLNYVLQTPDRRKQKQLCHLNMPYYTRNSHKCRTRLILTHHYIVF